MTPVRALLVGILIAGGCVPTDALDAAGTTGADSSTDGGDTHTTGASTGTTSPATTAGSDDDSSSDDGSSSGGGSGTRGESGSSSDGSDSSAAEASSSGDSGDETSSGGSSEGDSGGEAVVCTDTLMRTHVGRVEIHHDGDRFITHDDDGNLVLWDTASLDVLFETRDVEWADVAGGTLAYQTAGDLNMVATANGAALGEAPTELARGLARDGSYLWAASATELRVIDLDGSTRWSVAGAYSGAQVLALGDTLHVFALLESDDILHRAADDGSAASEAFTGTFGGWFADVPRYWTQQGQAYRVYDVDGTVLVLELGYPTYGWGSRIVLGTAIFDIFAPLAAIGSVDVSPRHSGPAILSQAPDGTMSLTHLDEEPITVESVAPICCVDDDAWTFGWGDGAWAVGGLRGFVADDLGRAVTSGEVVAIAGSTVGRVALALTDGLVRIADVAGDCGWDELASFARVGMHMKMSGDGSLLLSAERWTTMWGSNLDGTRFYALPDGDLVEEYTLSVMSDVLLAHDVADDASVWSRLATNTGVGSYTAGWLPLANGAILSGNSDVVPKIAPDGQHIVVSDGAPNPWTTWAGSASYIYEPDDFLAVLDGVAHGFLDESNVLVGRYDDSCGFGCVMFLGADIVDMDGDVVLTTTLPDVRELQRISDSEALVTVHASGDAAIYDVYAGTLLWEGPPAARAAVAGTDHVVVSTGTRVDLVRWR